MWQIMWCILKHGANFCFNEILCLWRAAAQSRLHKNTKACYKDYPKSTVRSFSDDNYGYEIIQVYNIKEYFLSLLHCWQRSLPEHGTVFPLTPSNKNVMLLWQLLMKGCHSIKPGSSNFKYRNLFFKMADLHSPCCISDDYVEIKIFWQS